MIDDLPLFQPTALQRRIIDAAVEIEECTPETIEFLHSVLCQVGLPRARTKERFFERNNGRASIAIEAGRLHKGGKWVEMPLPYGAKPRLALLHISSEAVRTRSGRIEIGESLRDFLLTLGLSTALLRHGARPRLCRYDRPPLAGADRRQRSSRADDRI